MLLCSGFCDAYGGFNHTSGNVQLFPMQKGLSPARPERLGKSLLELFEEPTEACPERHRARRKQCCLS